jgi:hypothetical protein
MNRIQPQLIKLEDPDHFRVRFESQVEFTFSYDWVPDRSFGVLKCDQTEFHCAMQGGASKDCLYQALSSLGHASQLASKLGSVRSLALASSDIANTYRIEFGNGSQILFNVDRTDVTIQSSLEWDLQRDLANQLLTAVNLFHKARSAETREMVD